MTKDNATPLKLDLSSDAGHGHVLPEIAAAFLVKFDHRKGCACHLEAGNMLTMEQLCGGMASSD